MEEQKWWEPLTAELPAETAADLAAYAAGSMTYEAWRERTVGRGEPDPERHVPGGYEPGPPERCSYAVRSVATHLTTRRAVADNHNPPEPGLLDAAYAYAATGGREAYQRLLDIMRRDI